LIKQISSAKTDRILASGSKIFGQQFNITIKFFIKVELPTCIFLSSSGLSALEANH